MERVPLQKRIVFFLLEPVRGARALFIARCHVTRRRLAEGLGLGAFKSDDFLGHELLLGVVRLGFLFLALGAFLLSQAEKRSDRLTDTLGLVLLFELRLAFDGETSEGDCLEPRMRDWFPRHFTNAV